jgi:hypothetical protein
LMHIRNGSIHDLVGGAWVQTGAISWYWLSWGAYDEARAEYLMCLVPNPTSPAELVAWNGLSFANRGVAPSVLQYASHELIVFHPQHGLTFAVSLPGVNGIALYSWNGLFASALPANAPPPTLSSNSEYRYHALTCDRQTGRLVLFGREEVGATGPIANVPILWDWDASSGWTNHGWTGSLPIVTRSQVWYDTHRGAIMRMDQTVPSQGVKRWVGGTSWVQVPTQWMSTLQDGSVSDMGFNRRYGRDTALGQLGYVGDVHPAEFINVNAFVGCSHPAAPLLRLTTQSSRAWLGNVMSVDVETRGAAFGGIAMGFTDQTWGGLPLPLSLASLGMPTCTLGVDPQLLIAVPAVADICTVTIPVPNQSALLGVQLFQQPFTLLPSANPAGLLMGWSTRATVGQAY